MSITVFQTRGFRLALGEAQGGSFTNKASMSSSYQRIFCNILKNCFELFLGIGPNRSFY